MNSPVKFLFLTVLLAFGCDSKIQDRLPEEFPVCNRDPQTINDCLLKAAEQVKPYLSKGVPELDIQPFNDFKVPFLLIENTSPGTNIYTKLNNMTIGGYEDYHVKNISFDFSTLKLRLHLEYGPFKIETDYFTKSTVFQIPMQGQGLCVLDISRSTIDMESDFKLVTRKGVEFLELDNIIVKMKVFTPHMLLTGLFDGKRPDVAEGVLKFLNDHLEELFELIPEVFDDMFTGFYKAFFTAFLKKVPYEVLFPVNHV